MHYLNCGGDGACSSALENRVASQSRTGPAPAGLDVCGYPTPDALVRSRVAGEPAVNAPDAVVGPAE
jgi:hypothetical protein